jgi:hypothetical protein
MNRPSGPTEPSLLRRVLNRGSGLSDASFGPRHLDRMHRQDQRRLEYRLIPNSDAFQNGVGKLGAD